MNSAIGSLAGAFAGGVIGFKKFGHIGFIPGVIIGGIIGFLAPAAGFKLWDIIAYTI